MEISTIKRLFDACHKAKRITELMPELPKGMTPRHIHVIDAIYQLGQRGKMVKVSDVSDFLHVTRPSITRLIGELEGLGVVTKRSDAADGRVVRLELTDRGLEYYEYYIDRYFTLIASRLEEIEEERLLDAAAVIDRAAGILIPPRNT